MSKIDNVNFKLDADEKKSMEQACSELSADPFYSFCFFCFLVFFLCDVNDGKAHFAENDLIEVD